MLYLYDLVIVNLLAELITLLRLLPRCTRNSKFNVRAENFDSRSRIDRRDTSLPTRNPGIKSSERSEREIKKGGGRKEEEERRAKNGEKERVKVFERAFASARNGMHPRRACVDNWHRVAFSKTCPASAGTTATGSTPKFASRFAPRRVATHSRIIGRSEGAVLSEGGGGENAARDNSRSKNLPVLSSRKTRLKETGRGGGNTPRRGFELT